MVKEVDERERHNLIHVLDSAIQALKDRDTKELKTLSNQTIHDATVYQDEHSIAVAVFIYSLSKIYDREVNYGGFKGWKKFCDTCNFGLAVAKEKLIHLDIQGFNKAMKSYAAVLSKLDVKLKIHIQDVLQRARINKASRLYEHGLSIGRTAELLGVTRFELMDYVGKTYIADMSKNITLSAKNRLEFTRGLFL